MSAFILDSSFAVANCFLHQCGHNGPPELALYEVQHLLLTVVSSISVTSIHHNHSMSCGDCKLHNCSQLTGQCMAKIEGSLIEHQLFLLSKDGHSLLSVCVISQKMLQILTIQLGIKLIVALSTRLSL